LDAHGTLPESLIDKWMISGIFGPVLDEVEIKKLQDQQVLADVKIYPIKFKHLKHKNFKIPEVDENGIVDDAFTVAQKASRKEQMYLNSYEESNKIILNIASKLIKEHPEWNILILFDYTSQGEQLYKLLNCETKHYVDGAIDVKDRLNIVEKMDKDGSNILIAQSKTFSTGITISRLNVIFLLNADTAATKIIQSIGRGLRRQNKNSIIVFDVFHNYTYSEKHFNDRLKLYDKFYQLKLSQDFVIKEIFLENNDFDESNN
jgi:superfamily II DNA or RNA helicase